MRPIGRTFTYMLFEREMCGSISTEQRVAKMLRCYAFGGGTGRQLKKVDCRPDQFPNYVIHPVWAFAHAEERG